MKKTNGDKTDSKSCADEIRSLIRRAGWSQNEAARIIYVNRNDTDNYEDIRVFQVTFKKQLQRASTPLGLLQAYLSILAQEPAVKKEGVVLGAYVPSTTLSSTVREGLEALSKEIDSQL